MKKIVSVSDFKEYCDNNKPHSVIYRTDNQEWYDTFDPCKIQITFPIILIFTNPSVVYLKSGDNFIYFDSVKSVEVDTESTILGTIFKLYCGEPSNDEDETTYTLVAK